MKKWIVTVCMLAALIGSVVAQNKVTLTSLDWPPYSGKSLADQGASIAVAKAAFKAMGYDLTVEFYPWERAVAMAKTDGRIAGYFPEYYSADNAKDFTYSAPMGEGPLGFVERKDSPIAWTTLNDLKSITIGVVSGYVNTDEFDAKVAKKEIKVEAVVDDITNLKKLINKRIKLAVIDKNVMNYLLKNDPSVSANKNDLQFNSKPLENKKLYICFKNNAEGQKLAGIYNEGLKKINVQQIMNDYFAKVNK